MKLGPNYSRGNKDIEKDLDESQLTKILIEKKKEMIKIGALLNINLFFQFILF